MARDDERKLQDFVAQLRPEEVIYLLYRKGKILRNEGYTQGG